MTAADSNREPISVVEVVDRFRRARELAGFEAGDVEWMPDGEIRLSAWLYESDRADGPADYVTALDRVRAGSADYWTEILNALHVVDAEVAQ